MQNAYSRQASVEVEQQLGDRDAPSASATSTCAACDLIMSVNQNVPTLRRGRHQQRLPSDSDLRATTASTRPPATRRYHGLHVSFVQRPTQWGYYRVSATRCRRRWTTSASSSSARRSIPSISSKDWGRSDDDQRHRLVFNGAINSSTAPAQTGGEQISHGFQVSGMLQAYSALPFNITSGVTTLQGTAGRPIVNGAFIARNAGTGPDFFSVNARVSRHVQARRPRSGSKGWSKGSTSPIATTS